MTYIGTLEGLKLQLWYHDDGVFTGSRSAIATLLHSILSKGLYPWLTRQFEKCDIFWPSGNQEFPEFDNDVQRTLLYCSGL